MSLERTWLQTVEPFRLRRVDRLEEQEPPFVLPERDVVLRAAAEKADELLLCLEMLKTRNPS